jgi:hypothetical protein
MNHRATSIVSLRDTLQHSRPYAQLESRRPFVMFFPLAAYKELEPGLLAAMQPCVLRGYARVYTASKADRLRAQ